MLKVNFDARQDHIGMFEPFVLDTIAHLQASDMDTEEVRAVVSSRHQLSLPTTTTKTLLGRIVKNGWLRREGGRYFTTDKPLDVSDVQVERQRAQQRQNRLAVALRTAAAERGAEIASDDDALAMILDFVDAYQVALAFDELPGSGLATVDPTENGDRLRIITAGFLRDTIAEGGELASVIQEMLEGFVLQNTLLLKDIAVAGRQFRDLHVFFDSGLLFGALGLRGPASERAVRELIVLLRDTGAIVDIFEPTIAEMHRVLAVYEERIGTTKGRLSLYPTDLTRHLVSQRFTPSDVHMAGGLLESNLRRLGFNIRALPAHDPRWTLDERALGKRLADRRPEPGRPRKSESEPRVVHDIDCVAGVLTYRKGQSSDSIDHAVAVFATTSGLTVMNTRLWYLEQGGRGFPPIVHYLALSNFAWLKKPASATVRVQGV